MRDALWDRAERFLIGLLGAIGLKPRQIAFLFLLEGTLIGMVGVVAGVAFGLAINGSLSTVGMDFSSYSNLTEYMALISGRVYPTLGLRQVVSRALIVLVISMLAALFPAWEASQREPAEALHSV